MSGANPKRCALCHRFQWAFVVPVCAMPGKLASLRGALTWQDRPAVCRHSEPDSAVGGPGSTAARAGNALKPPRGAQHHAALSTLSLLSVMPELKPTQKPGKARGSRLGFGKAIWLQGEVVGTSSRDRVHATVSRAMDSREAPEQGNRASARPLASPVRCAEEHSPSAVWTSNAL